MINTLAIEYLSARSEERFIKLRAAVNDKWAQRKRNDAKKVYDTEDEVQSLYDLALVKALEKYDVSKGNFESYLSVCVVNERNKLYNKKLKIMSNEIYIIDDDNEEDDRKFDPPDESISLRQRERDQRQLVSDIYGSSDDFTKQVIDVFLSGVYTANAIGKSLGVHHTKVMRCLDRLSVTCKKRFGETAEFLHAS